MRDQETERSSQAETRQSPRVGRRRFGLPGRQPKRLPPVARPVDGAVGNRDGNTLVDIPAIDGSAEQSRETLERRISKAERQRDELLVQARVAERESRLALANGEADASGKKAKAKRIEQAWLQQKQEVEALKEQQRRPKGLVEQEAAA